MTQDTLETKELKPVKIKPRQIDTCEAAWEPEKGFIVVTVDGVVKHVVPQHSEPTEDELSAAKSECLEKYKLVLRNGPKAAVFAYKFSKTDEYKRTAEHCYSHIMEEREGDGCLRIDNADPSRLLQWQHSFANWKSKLKYTDELMYKKACFVTTRMVPRNKLTNEPAYLLITPRYWEEQ